MNTLKIKMWLEHQQVAATTLLTGGLVFVLLYFLLSPLNHKCNRLETEINDMKSQLAMKNYLIGEEALQEKKQEEQMRNNVLRKEWDNMVKRVSAFPKPEESPNVGHIDFKVALFDVRQRLMKKSRTLNVELPSNLGMDDAVHSDKDARKLMLHLRTVEKLVDLALDLKIVALKNITPLPPVLHETEGKIAFLEEYPVQMEFSGSLKNLYDLLQSALQPKSTFALKHIRVDAGSANRPDLLNINVVMSSLVFLKTPDEMPVSLQPGTIRSRPKGY